MDVDKPLSGYKYQASPKYNNIEFRNFQTPKFNLKNETSQNILNQTKESLHNFLLNLKKTSILQNNAEINDANIISGLSSISNINNIEEMQGSNESYNINRIGKFNDGNINNNNLETNILNYNKIYNTNNVYNLGNKSLIQNKAKIRQNKKIEPFQMHEKIYTENDLNSYLNNNLYNTINTNQIKSEFPLYNSLRREKYNYSLGKNMYKSEEKKPKLNTKLVISLKEKLKSLKSENLQNKKDIINLSNTYNEMQKTLLDKITQIINEKNNKIKELENKIKQFEEEQKRNNMISEKNKKLMNDIESLNKEIKKLNKNNQELQKTIKNKDNIIKKCNEDIKEIEAKLKKYTDKDDIKIELKEKEEELNYINSESDNKLRSYQELLLDYKTKNDELIKENKSLIGLNNILKSQKKALTKENGENKQIVAELKIENEKLIKERDDYKIKKEKLINEIEIIKLNNDRIYNIKSLTNNNTNKLKNEISSLKKEKEILGEQNSELQKRIKSLDRKHSQNKSLKAKSKTVSHLKKDKLNKFIDLKIIKVKELVLNINNSTKNKNVNKKNTPKKVGKKTFIKFKKLFITNKVVDICINKKGGANNNNKKAKKKINKFKKVSQCSKIVDIFIKKTTPKPKKKKFMKLKSINEVVNICIKTKINNKKFISNKLKISSKVNFFDINEKKKVDLKISNPEIIFFEKSFKQTKIEENKIKEEIKNENLSGITKEIKNKNKIYQINKLETIKFEGKIKNIILNINKTENFSLKEKTKQKTTNINLSINKNESITYLKPLKGNKTIKNNTLTITAINQFNILCKQKIIKPFETSSNNIITLIGLKKSFINLDNNQNSSFNIISKSNIIKRIFEISKNETLSYNRTDKKIKLIINNRQNIAYKGIRIKKKIVLKKENNTSLFFKPKKNAILLSKSYNEQSTQNKPKFMSFFSNFMKPKKTNILPMRILTIQYRKSKREKMSELNKRNKISSQNKLNFSLIKKKKKLIKYEINNSISLNYQQVKKIPNFNIINTNSFSFEEMKTKFDLSLISNPEMLKGEENLKQLIKELNKALNLKNDEIRRLEKEKADTDLANQLFNDSSNEQIENLKNNLSTIKEKNEKLNEQIEKLKEEINNDKKILEEKNKEYNEKKNYLNKTIEDLTKENSQLKLKLFKQGTESDSASNEKQEEANKNINVNNDKLQEYEKKIETLKEDLNKMRQSKIIETNQLKLEITKNKVEMKRLTNQIKKLESEKSEPKKEGQDNNTTLKLNNIIENNQDNKDEIKKLKNEIETYKSKISEMNIEIKKNEELRHQNILFTHKIQEAQKKITQANQVIGKAKKYGLCMSYLTQFLGILNPQKDKEVYLVNKLKEFTDDYQKEKSNK